MENKDFYIFKTYFHCQSKSETYHDKLKKQWIKRTVFFNSYFKICHLEGQKRFIHSFES